MFVSSNIDFTCNNDYFNKYYLQESNQISNLQACGKTASNLWLKTTMINKTLFTFFASALLFISFHSPLYSAVYKWVDENGQVHYGDQPQEFAAERMKIRTDETTELRPIKNPEQQDEEKSGTDNSKDEKQNDTAEQPAKPETPAISMKEKRRLCKEAKTDIAAINSRGRVREINAKGEYHYLSEKQRQQRLSAARKKQRENCR